MTKYQELISMVKREDIASRDKVSLILKELKYLTRFSNEEINNLFKIIQELDRDLIQI